ncbi:DUF2690 domain-containing protein [Streptomyces netropsis]|uniref:DUF2690 domain-containing protein n=1 Tax=Streptomyces netropsis TaxID=55404 RepID=UPI0037A6F3A3
MGSPGESAPHEARDAAEFVALLRQLKARSGLTFRQLEERAAARGDVLARSTLADALRHDALPRAETLTAFLRACGEEGNVGAWLEARERLCAADAPGAAHEEQDGPADRRPSRWRTRSFRIAAAAGVAVFLAAGGLAGARYFDGQGPDGPTVTGEVKRCRNGTCKGKDPQEFQCLGDAAVASAVKSAEGLIYLYHSAGCQALWAGIGSGADKVVSVYVKSGRGDALSLKRDRLLGDPAGLGSARTPMLPSKELPRHAEVCVTYREMEACTGSDGMSRVKPYPSAS